MSGPVPSPSIKGINGDEGTESPVDVFVIFSAMKCLGK